MMNYPIYKLYQLSQTEHTKALKQKSIILKMSRIDHKDYQITHNEI